jgi:hypothetical protein
MAEVSRARPRCAARPLRRAARDRRDSGAGDVAEGKKPRVVTTLHGTDTTLLGRDAGYGPAISHALAQSDAVTTVSEFLRRETVRLLGVRRPIEVIHNFFEPHPPRPARAPRNPPRTRSRRRRGDDAAPLQPARRQAHPTCCSPPCRESSRAMPLQAGHSRRQPTFGPFQADVKRLGLEAASIVREQRDDIESTCRRPTSGCSPRSRRAFA